HPLRVAASEVVVDRDEVDAFAGEGVQIQRHGGDEGLALAGRHLGDLALVQNDTADHLHVVRHHLPLGGNADDVPGRADERLTRRLHQPERFGQKVVDGGTFLDAATKL